MERSGLYIKKAGTIILALSMILWVLTNYPKPSDKVAQNTAPALTSGALVSDVSLVAAIPEADLKSQALAYSYAGRLGRKVEPLLKPMGFDWKIGTALVGSLAAKEVFVAQMGIVYSVGSEEDAQVPLREQLSKNYSPLIGFCIMLFCLLSAPCIATFAVTRRESGAWRWAFLQFGGLTVLAYAVTTVVYQAGRLMGLGA